MDTVIKWSDLSNFKSSTELSGHFKRCILGTCKVGLPSRFYYSNSTDQRVVFMNLSVNLRYLLVVIQLDVEGLQERSCLIKGLYFCRPHP